MIIIAAVQLFRFMVHSYIQSIDMLLHQDIKSAYNLISDTNS